MRRIGISNNIHYSFDELKYKLFSKKICPQCGGKMKSEFEKKYLGRGYGSISRRRYPADIYEFTQFYRCIECGKKYSISELIK